MTDLRQAAQQPEPVIQSGEILTKKDLMLAVTTAVMSSKQADRDDACRKLQRHIVAVEHERDDREAECERLAGAALAPPSASR